MAHLGNTIVNGNLKVLNGLSGDGSGLTALNASNIASGTLNAARLATSGATAGSYGPSANASPAHGGTFSVPYLTVDAYGRVTAISTKEITLPGSGDTDVKVTNTLGTTTKFYVTGTTSATTNTGTQYFDTGVYVSTTAGELVATKFTGNLTGNVTGNCSGSAGSVAWANVTDKPSTFPSETHGHNYAGSSSDGGAATSANKLNTDAGSATQPVYFSNGIPVATTYTLSKSVPSNAVFTDTNTKVTNTLGTTTKFYVTGTTSATTNTGTQYFDTGVYVSTTAGELVATKFTGELNGNAATATKLGTSTVGGTTTPIYLNAGAPTALSYTIAKSVPSDAVFTDTTYSAGTGLSLSGTTFNHSNSVTAGTVGTSSATSGSTLAVPYVTYDAQGHITATGTHTHTVSGFLTAHQTVKQDAVTGATANRYGACSTAAATAAKTVSITSGTPALEAGLKVTVKFTNANTAGTPTLNVNSLGAKNIFHNGAQITTGGNKALLAGICDFVYDGTQWHLVGNYIDTVYTHPTTAGNKHIPSGGSSGNFLKYSSAGTATWASITGADAVLTGYSKASSASAVAATDTVNAAIGKLEKALDGKQASGSYLTSHQTVKQDAVTGATSNRFGTCGTAAATAAKTVSITAGTPTLEAGLKVTVKFTNANTAGTPTLNVNSLGAKNIFHKGAQITTGSNKALLAGVCDFVYDGTQWHLVGNYIDTDTVYTHPTGAGNNHIPSGGSSGQILKYSASGTATWANEYSYTHPTTAGNKHIPTGGSTGQVLIYGGSSGTASWGTITGGATLKIYS